MADERQFKFVSPGIYVNEIDNSQLPGLPSSIGPAIIGRFPRGPALRPVSVSTFAEFVEQFGNPVPGKTGGDIWRQGNTLGPTYAAYAAQAWLKNTPQATIVRVLGRSHNDQTNAVGKAGWQIGKTTGVADNGTAGGAYGLVIAKSGSGAAVDAALAAIIYCKEGSVELSGSKPSDGVAHTGSCAAVLAAGAHHEYRLLIKNSANANVEDVLINFDPTSDKYIRDRINTNPTLMNSAVTLTGNQKTYVLGQTFDRHVWDSIGAGSAATGEGGQAFIVGLALDSPDVATAYGANAHRRNTQPSRTGWFVGQDLTSNNSTYSAKDQQKLFRVEGLDDGEWCQNNIKISIEDVKASTNKSDPYGTFSLNLRRIDDSDGATQYVERYSSLTLNPNSPNYVGKRIGDQYFTWSETERQWTIRGNYSNQSRFIRVRMDATVDDGASDPAYLPFGFFSNPRLLGQSTAVGSAQPKNYGTSDFADGAAGNERWIALATVVRNSPAADLAAGCAASTRFDIQWPAMPMRSSSKDGSLSDPTRTFFGFDTSQKTTSLGSTKKYDASVTDVARAFPSDGTDPVYSYAPNGVDATADAEVAADNVNGLQAVAEAQDILAAAQDHSAGTPAADGTDVFSLDDLVLDGSHATWTQGSRQGGSSITAGAGKSYKEVLDKGFDKYCVPMFGGFDGLDICEQEPLRNSSAVSAHGGGDTLVAPLDSGTELNSAPFNSIKMAMDVVSNPDRVECNAIVSPGLTNTDLTDHMMEIAEGRADMLAVVDLEGGYVPTTEAKTETLGKVGGSDGVVNLLKARDINSSYACSYYPWVQISDTVNGTQLWVPPSVAALGVFSSTDRNEELWFAPAGFTRGGLSQNGAAGIPVTGVRHRLTAKERDSLYEASVNPIAQFPAEGIVIFGQKTLQVTPSALDRINVRRLMVYLKREISKIAATTLFDQNVQATWDRFKGPAEILLASVKARYGLSNYKLVLDESTTTADLIERNILYAKVLLAPTKAIEFIALDFVVTRAGASFDD
jgi:hypothetical protein